MSKDQEFQEPDDPMCERCGKSLIVGGMLRVEGVGWMHWNCEINRLNEALKNARMELGLIDSQSRRGLIFHHISNTRRIIRDALGSHKP